MAVPHSTRRRWFQFGLKGLMLFVVVIAIVAAWVGRERTRSRHEMEIARQLTDQGAVVDMAGLFYFANEADLPAIPEIAPSVWRKFLSDLCGLSVREVHLQRTDIGPDTIVSLSDLTRMRRLSLGYTETQNLIPLAGLRNLEILEIQSTPLKDLTPLAKLNKLELLMLGSTQVSDLTPLAGLTALHTVTAERSLVRDVTPLAGLKKLKQLDLSGTQVSDLTPLVGLTNLRHLSVDKSEVSEAHVQWFRQRRPDCEVVFTAASQLPAPGASPEN